MAELPLNPFYRILKQRTGLRVSRDAAEELRLFCETEASEIASNAAEVARHAGRKTVQREDVALSS